MKKVIARVLLCAMLLSCLVIVPVSALTLDDRTDTYYTRIFFSLQGGNARYVSYPCVKTTSTGSVLTITAEGDTYMTASIYNYKTGSIAGTFKDSITKCEDKNYYADYDGGNSKQQGQTFYLVLTLPSSTDRAMSGSGTWYP